MPAPRLGTVAWHHGAGAHVRHGPVLAHPSGLLAAIRSGLRAAGAAGTQLAPTHRTHAFCRAVSYCVLPCRTLSYSALLGGSVLHRPMPYSVVLCRSLPYSTVRLIVRIIICDGRRRIIEPALIVGWEPAGGAPEMWDGNPPVGFPNRRVFPGGSFSG